jgi:hypothetical protein
MAALDDILQRHPVWRGGAGHSPATVLPTGFAPLDHALPGGGWPTGALTEIFGAAAGIGELQLVLPALSALSWAGKRIVWLAPPHLPYPPALAAAGVDLARIAVVRAPGRRDALWAAEQALRSGGCHALLAWFRHPRYEEVRRLAVAAESSAAWMALFRPPEGAHEPSPAVLRLALEPGPVVRILKSRGRPVPGPISITVPRPVHALGRTPFPVAPAGKPRADRRLGLPVHA